jgi:hypothetical protein
MKNYIGNPHAEVHGHNLNVFEFQAPPGTDPVLLADALEAGPFADHHLYHKKNNIVHGYVNTKSNIDGTLHVWVCLYMTPCEDNDCDAGHGPINFIVSASTLSSETIQEQLLGLHLDNGVIV